MIIRTLSGFDFGQMSYLIPGIVRFRSVFFRKPKLRCITARYGRLTRAQDVDSAYVAYIIIALTLPTQRLHWRI